MYKFLIYFCFLLYLSPVFSGVVTEELDAIPEDAISEVEEIQSELTEAVDQTFTEDDLVEEIQPESDVEISLDEEGFTDELTIIDSSKDVFLVLDNSGSMKKNDPDFLMTQAVREFISQQDENTRVGIVIFDQSVRIAVPLTDASLENREQILNSIEDINYKGLFTDSPAGIERAIYELKNNGRSDAQKSIIFMTDGIVDTGVPEKDLQKSEWLREDLAPDAADNDIKIFGIAFTDEADFQLIQSIAQKTDGEYYRATKAEDLQSKFEEINDIIHRPPEPDPVPVETQPQPVEVQPAPIVQPAPAPAPVIIEVPAQTMGEEERIRSIIIIAAAIVLIITLVAILFLLLRRNRELKAEENAFVQEAYINDLHGKTNKETHKLGKKPTMFGRVAGKDTDHLDYIVVGESTIGRRHALIEYKDYSFWIIDQGSINGTYVNGEQVNSEVRLKHGDRIRLHKCDFEFVMPEMEDSGMTQISNTVFANQPAAFDDSEEATQIRDHDTGQNDLSSEEIDSVKESSDMDFDITGMDGPDDLADMDVPDDEAETIVPDRPSPAVAEPTEEPDFDITESRDDESEDEKNSDDDETIMLDDGDGFDPDDDATIRRDDI